VLEIETYDDVQRLHFSSWRSRAAGYSVSAYAVRGVVVDSAFDDAGPELLAWIAANRPAGIIITHAHDDHGGNAERLARAGIPMQMQPDTATLLATPQRRGPHRHWAWGGMPLLRSPWTSFESPALEMIPARGHSPDHYVVWDAERETLFAADLFLGVKVKVAHPTHREDVRQQIGSIRRVLDLKPKRIFDAHKGLLRDGVALLAAKANWIEETCGEIDALIANGWDDVAIAREVFGPEPLFTWITLGDWSHRNFVASVRSTRSPS
jgi:glyoxylase-like metal-dependent hydrolase (beta-lactamase superfamily II)